MRKYNKEKMVKRGLMILFLIMVCVNFVAATETKIDIKTLPDHEVQVAISKANSINFIEIEKSKAQSDKYGDASFTFNFPDSTYNMFVFIKKDNERVIDEKFFDLLSGESQYFEIAPLGAVLLDTPELEEVVLNESLNETLEEDINETGDLDSNEKEGSSLTGSATDIGERVKDFFSGKIIYFIIGAVVVGVVVLVGGKKGYRIKIVKKENVIL